MIYFEGGTQILDRNGNKEEEEEEDGKEEAEERDEAAAPLNAKAPFMHDVEDIRSMPLLRATKGTEESTRLRAFAADEDAAVDAAVCKSGGNDFSNLLSSAKSSPLSSTASNCICSGITDPIDNSGYGEEGAGIEDPVDH